MYSTGLYNNEVLDKCVILLQCSSWQVNAELVLTALDVYYNPDSQWSNTVDGRFPGIDRYCSFSYYLPFYPCFCYMPGRWLFGISSNCISLNPVSYRWRVGCGYPHATCRVSTLERPKEELTGLLTTMIDTNWRPWGEVGEEEGATW